MITKFANYLAWWRPGGHRDNNETVDFDLFQGVMGLYDVTEAMRIAKIANYLAPACHQFESRHQCFLWFGATRARMIAKFANYLAWWRPGGQPIEDIHRDVLHNLLADPPVQLQARS
jgi:hypothetical protein